MKNQTTKPIPSAGATCSAVKNRGMAYIRKHYGVSAMRGGRVRYSGNIGLTPLDGTIIGTTGARLCVLFDGEVVRRILHPTWELQYLHNAKMEQPGQE